MTLPGSTPGRTTATGNTVVDIAQFTGRENDAGTALYYFRARYYAPTIDRFISQDPARSDWNLYTYAQSDPVTLTDPLGLKPGDPYPSVDAAAVAALQEFNPRSIQVDAEIGGSIYCDGSQYKYTVPNIQIVYSDFVRSSRPPAGKKRVGDYHTHGRHGNIGLSSQDKANADALRIPFYLGTPIGSIIKYDPKIGIQVTLPFLTRVPK